MSSNGFGREASVFLVNSRMRVVTFAVGQDFSAYVRDAQPGCDEARAASRGDPQEDTTLYFSGISQRCIMSCWDMLLISG